MVNDRAKHPNPQRPDAWAGAEPGEMTVVTSGPKNKNLGGLNEWRSGAGDGDYSVHDFDVGQQDASKARSR